MNASPFFAAVLFFLAGAASVSGNSPDQLRDIAIVEELRALERRRSEAIATRDLEFLQALYADDFRGVTATGYEVDKARLLGVFARGDGGLRFTLEILDVRVFEGIAFVTGRLTGTTPFGEIKHDSRYVHVYQKRTNRWQMIFGQGTLLPPARSGN